MTQGESMTTEAQPDAADDTPLTRSAWALYYELEAGQHFSRSIKQEEAHAIVADIIEAFASLTSENDRLTRQLKLATDGLERIATEHQEYRATASALDSTYSTGVTDGHRCAAQIARDTLAAVKEVANVE